MYGKQPQASQVSFKYTVPDFCDPEAITCIMQPGENQGCGVYIGNLESARNG